MSFSKDSAPPVSAKPGSETTVSAQDTHALSGNEDLEEPAMVADLIMTAKKQTLPIHVLFLILIKIASLTIFLQVVKLVFFFSLLAAGTSMKE